MHLTGSQNVLFVNYSMVITSSISMSGPFGMPKSSTRLLVSVIYTRRTLHLVNQCANKNV